MRNAWRRFWEGYMSVFDLVPHTPRSRPRPVHVPRRLLPSWPIKEAVPMPDIFDLPDLSPDLAKDLSRAIAAALEAAKTSPCHKDQRGAAVFHPDFIYPPVAASNGPPRPFACDGSDACKFSCGKLAVHAEERALHRWAARPSGRGKRRVWVVHVRVVYGQPVPSGPPSCITCSRTMVELDVSQVWLWHETGWRGYSAVEFHELSLHHEKHNLPVIMEKR